MLFTISSPINLYHFLATLPQVEKQANDFLEQWLHNLTDKIGFWCFGLGSHTTTVTHQTQSNNEPGSWGTLEPHDFACIMESVTLALELGESFKRAEFYPQKISYRIVGTNVESTVHIQDSFAFLVDDPVDGCWLY